MSNTILLVEPDPERVPMLERVLGLAGHSVVVTNDNLEALETFQRIRPDLVVIDAVPPDLQGFELCHVLKETPQGQWTPILVACDRQDGKSFRAQALHEHGADEFVETPLDDDEFSACVGRLIGSWAVQREAAERVNNEHAETVEKPTASSRMMDDDTVIEALDHFDSLVDEVELDRPCIDEASTVFHTPTTRRDPLRESLDDLAQGADDLIDQLRDEPPVAAPTGESAASLRASLDELSHTVPDEVAPMRPEIQVGGDHGADIEGHLDDLFAHGLVTAGSDEAESETVVSDSEPLTAEIPVVGRREAEEADVQPPADWRPEPALAAPQSAFSVSGEAESGMATESAPEPARRVVETATLEVEPRARVPVAEIPLTFTEPEIRRRGASPVAWGIAASVAVILGGAFWLQSMRGTASPASSVTAQVRTVPTPAPTPASSTLFPPPPPAVPDVIAQSDASRDAPAVAQAPVVDEPAAVMPSLPAAPPVKSKPSEAAAPSRPAEAKPAEARPTLAAPTPAAVTPVPAKPAVVAPPPATAAVKPVQPAPAPVTTKPEAATPDTKPPVVAAIAEPSLPPAPPVAPKPMVASAEPKPATAVAKPAPAPRPAATPVVEPPVAVRRVEPAYPPKAVKRAEGGAVVLRVLVSEAGRPVRVVVEQGMDGSELEAAAIDAVLRWEYRPATENGQPVRSWTTERFEFKPPE